MSSYRDEAVVLRTIRLGEADRIVTLVTPEHGKVRAVAKGVRRTKSRLGARVEPLTHVALLAWRGRELDIITQVEVIDSFRAIRENLDLLTPAMTMLEIVDQVAVERHAAGTTFDLLVKALRSLESSSSPLVLGAFCWRLLAAEGVAPIVEVCAHCGSTGPLVAFSMDEGGLLCRNCRRGQGVAPEVVALVQQITSGGLGRALRGPAGPEVAAFEHLATSAVEYHLDRRLRSMRHRPDGDTGAGERVQA